MNYRCKYMNLEGKECKENGELDECMQNDNRKGLRLCWQRRRARLTSRRTGATWALRGRLTRRKIFKGPSSPPSGFLPSTVSRMFPSGWQSARCQLVGVSLNTYGEFPFSFPGWVGILPGEDSPWEVWNGRALLFWVSACRERREG